MVEGVILVSEGRGPREQGTVVDQGRKLAALGHNLQAGGLRYVSSRCNQFRPPVTTRHTPSCASSALVGPMYAHRQAALQEHCEWGSAGAHRHWPMDPLHAEVRLA